MDYYIDSHTHITNEDLDFDLYLEDVKKAKDSGVLKALFVMSEERELALLNDLEADDYFDIAYGIYPSGTKTINEEEFIKLKEVLKSHRFIALGEIGLDYHWYEDNKEIQKEIFKRQIKLADELDLPIIIHARDSLNDTLEILKETPNKRKGVMHCYSGSLEMAKEFIKLGYYISFSGSLTFTNNKKGPLTAKGIDLNYLLCETDAPYLAPVPKRGQRNETANVIFVYEFLSKLLDIPLERLKKIVKENYERLFYEKAD